MINVRKFILLAIDVLFLIIAYISSYTVSTVSSAMNIEIPIFNYFINFIFYFVCIFAARLFLRIYYNVWRYPSTSAYLKIVIADVCGSVCAFFITRLLFDLRYYISIWNAFVNVSLFTLLTLISRFAYQYYMNLRNRSISDHNKIGVAIVGAGKTGSLLVEELLYNSNSHYKPLCFIDTDRYKIGGYISGIKVIDENRDVIKILKDMSVKEIFIALPKITSEDARNMYDFYSKTGCKIKLYDFAINDNTNTFTGKRQLRDIKIEDLLFRDSLYINNSETFKYYNNKTVLVTGGGGSIGSEICRQIAKTNPKKLIIFDIYENNAYDIQQELKSVFGDSLELHIEIGSVRDKQRLNDIFDKYRPEIVFHAAAHKHVPLMEESSCEAIKNNVFGTYNTANCSEEYGVKKFIMISTDKAVNPTNVMGATKRLCEMIVQSRFDSKTTEFVAVRFGNVLGSNGSVIPLFRRQIEAGGPVTITDKRIIRYFMTIPEASQLVLQAGAMAARGELFVLDMGNPVKIIDLATNMIKLAGYVPNKDIQIVETGLRPGEKLYEELLIKNEELYKTDNDLIFIEKDKPFTRDEVEAKLDMLRNLQNGSNSDIKDVLKQIVPTYHSAETVNKKVEAETANA